MYDSDRVVLTTLISIILDKFNINAKPRRYNAQLKSYGKNKKHLYKQLSFARLSIQKSKDNVSPKKNRKTEMDRKIFMAIAIKAMT